jgi:hypothetical protein
MQTAIYNPKIDVLPLSSGRPKGFWGDSLQMSRPITLALPQTEGQVILCKHHQAVWDLALHWIYKKKWNHSHKLPVTRRKKDEVALVEPFADVFLAWLNLCEALHTNHYTEYANAGEWFTQICNEINFEVYHTIFAETEDSLFCGTVARDLAIAIWDGSTNPFCQETQPHQWLAAELGRQSKANAPQIFTQFYRGKQRQKPHLGLGAAYSAFATSKQNDGHAHLELKQGVLTLADKGRKRTKLILPK